MPIRTVILDFDGTCTDVDREAQGFLAGYKADLARLMGVADLDHAWQEAERRIRQDPSRHGWVIAGRMVAPPVDLYLLATAVSSLLAPDLSDAETERLFKENYRFTTTAFRPRAREVVEAFAAAGVHFFVVTNSDAARVGDKLDALAPRGRERVQLRGDARKFVVAEPSVHADDPRFASVPETLEVADWDRPVYARRGHYFDALASIWAETGSTPAETLVVGDVFELDLAMPALLGCRVHLAASPRTLDYERRGVEAVGGRADEDLASVLAYLS